MYKTMPMPIHRPQGQITTLPFFRKPNVMSGLFKKITPNSSTIFKK